MRAFDESDKKKLRDALSPESNVIILIELEDDFSLSEIDLEIEPNFIPVSLGRNRLRTEQSNYTIFILITYSS